MNYSENKLRRLTLLYTENAKVAQAFWDIRYKIVTRFFVLNGSCIVFAGWLYKEQALRDWSGFPFFLAALLSIVSFLMDRVNAQVFKNAYNIGKELESELTDGLSDNIIEKGGIYTAINSINEAKAKSHTYFLILLYLGSAILSIGIGLISIDKVQDFIKDVIPVLVVFFCGFGISSV